MPVDWHELGRALGGGILAGGQQYLKGKDIEHAKGITQAEDWELRYRLYKPIAKKLGVSLPEEPRLTPESMLQFQTKLMSNPKELKKYGFVLPQKPPAEPEEAGLTEWVNRVRKLGRPLNEDAMKKKYASAPIKGIDKNDLVKSIKEGTIQRTDKPNIWGFPAIRKGGRTITSYLTEDALVEILRAGGVNIPREKEKRKVLRSGYTLRDIEKENPDFENRIKNEYANYVKDLMETRKEREEEWRRQIFWRVPSLKTLVLMLQSDKDRGDAGRVIKDTETYVKWHNTSITSLEEQIASMKGDLKLDEEDRDVARFIEDEKRAMRGMLAIPNTSHFSFEIHPRDTVLNNRDFWSNRTEYYINQLTHLINAYAGVSRIPITGYEKQRENIRNNVRVAFERFRGLLDEEPQENVINVFRNKKNFLNFIETFSNKYLQLIGKDASRSVRGFRVNQELSKKVKGLWSRILDDWQREFVAEVKAGALMKEEPEFMKALYNILYEVEEKPTKEEQE